MVRACHANDYPTARKLFYSVRNIIDLLFADGNPAGVKAALNILGLCEETVRLPLVTANRKVYEDLKAEIAKL